MRFTSNARPTLTPLGHRLLHLSENKLNNLEPALGGRDAASLLWKGVIVREAIKSAWRSVEDGVQAEMNDWSAQNAMGLDVIGEDEEEEEEEYEEEGRWFEELVTSFGEDDFADAGATAHAHEWADANVASAFDDVEYDEGGMEAYTFPSTSPTLTAVASVAATPLVDYNASTSTPSADVTSTEVEVVEVSDDEHESIDEIYGATSVFLPLQFHVFPPQPLQPILEPLSTPHALPLAPHPTPLTPISPFTLDYSDDLDECADSFLLPPPLVRSWSSTSADEDDDPCVTPPQVSCEELEEEAPVKAVEGGYEMTKRMMGGQGWLGLRLDDDGDDVSA